MRRTARLVSLLPLGPIPYDEALARQHAAAEEVRRGGAEALLLLEHRSVITIGRNAGREDLLASDSSLADLGVDVRVSDRGGKLTFHGPGQLVAYPILNLAPGATDVRRYVRSLEEVLIRTAGDFGVEAGRSCLKERWSSVWVGNDKLAAIGIHISRWVTTHGVAMNVSTDLTRFSLIVPCGIRDGGVTSLEKLRGQAATPSLPRVAEAFARHFSVVFERDWEEAQK
jgi:lipoyl(octanoyl) transferase